MKKPIALDLFSGVGGLSAGLVKAGFDVQVAVELSKEATETYERNHPKTKIIHKDIRNVTSKEVLASCSGPVDLLAGCAPCQGFCSLTTKLRRDDPRNLLVLEMLRLIREIRPRAVFMENVPGLASRGGKILKTFISSLKRLGYSVETSIVQMADYGVPQSRRRFVLLAGLGFAIPIPTATHARNPLKKSIRNWKTIAKAIGKMPKPTTMAKAIAAGGPRKFNWHVVRDLKPITLMRLKAAIPGKGWKSIEKSLRPTCHQGDYEGFSNVYGRMTWDQVSPTITRGCTTPCHGRFGHPSKRRTTISVREAAILQTFPSNYKFETDSIQAVCEMIGNAVPPLFAKKVAKQVLSEIS